MGSKLYCYADESGQDTEGRLFVVAVAIVDALIRLADSVCGLVRSAQAGQEDMQDLLDWAVKTGALVALD